MNVPIPVMSSVKSKDNPSKLKSSEIPKVGIHSCLIKKPLSITLLEIKEAKNKNKENGNTAKYLTALLLS